MSAVDTTRQMEAFRHTDDAADLAIERLTTSARPHRSTIDVLGRWGRGLWSTPNRAAGTAVWAVAVVILAVTAVSATTRSVQTALGPARITCGLNIYLYGNPDPAVKRVCAHAESGRAALFTLSLVVVLAGVLVAVILAGRNRALPCLRPPGSHPDRAATLSIGMWVVCAVGLAGAVAAAAALRPAPVAINQSGTVVSLRCGADTYFGGYPDRAVQAACRSAYSGQAHVLEVALLAVVLAAVAAVSLFLSSGRLDRRRLGAGTAAAILAVLAVVSLSPVTVQVRGGPAPEVASCGLDTYLAGYPEASVQDACRARYGTRAAIGIPAGALALAAAGWCLLRRPRQLLSGAEEQTR